MKNILSICQEVAGLVATQSPQDLFSGNSQQEAVFLSLMRDTLDSLLRFGDWPELTREGTLVTKKECCDYLITDICSDFFCLLNNTIYIKDTAEKVVGAITAEQWMKDKYMNCPSLDIKFKIQGEFIKFLTPPPDTVSIVFQYRSNTTVLEGGKIFKGREKAIATSNTDIPVFDEFLVRKGLIWRWLKRNGMDYTEEYHEYEKALRSRMASGSSVGDICLSGTSFNQLPEGVIVHVATTN